MKRWGIIIKTLITILLLQVSLCATDFVKLYQHHGLKALEKQLDETLTTSEYWLKRVADKNVTYGLFSDFSELLFCNKNEGNLTRVSIDTNHTLSIRYHLNTLIGGGKGDKQKEGDLKTPLGVYFLKSRIDHPGSFYGPLALVTNYPNRYDRSQHKNGSGIWIHGKPFKGTRDAYTKGCLVIDNSDLTYLNKSIDYHKAALVISPKDFPKTDKQTVAGILSDLFLWRNYWKNSNLKPYLDFYNPDFKRPNGTSLQEFSINKQNVFSTKIKRRIHFHHINIIPYPNEDNRKIFYISFFEEYDAGHVRFHGRKELYIELINNHMSILTES